MSEAPKKAEIGFVPSRWDVGLLVTFLDKITYGFTNPMPDAVSGPWKLTAKDVVDGRINYETARHTTQEAFEKDLTEKSKPRIDDVLLTKDGSIGRVAVVDREGVCINQSVALLRPNEKILPHFLKYLLLTPHYQEVMERDSDGSTIKHIYITRVDKMEVAVPPIDEQGDILDILKSIDDKIELNRRMNETLEAMARAIFKSWFVDFDPVRAKASGEPPESICRRLGLTPDVLALFPDSFQDSELGEIPKGWTVRSFGEMCDRIAMGPFGSNIKTSNFVPHGVPIVRGGNLTNGFVDDRFVFLTEEKADQLRNSNARPGNIVITHRGTLGQVGLIPNDCRYPRYVVSQSQMVLSARSEVASGRYLYEFLRSPIGQQALLANTSQVGVPAIAQPTTSVKAIRVAAPPVTILRAYDLATKSLFDHASGVGKQSATLAKIRDELLPHLLSGQVATVETHEEVEVA